MIKLVSWNVNGFRAVLKKGFQDFFNESGADIFAMQETKMQEGQADFCPEGYFMYWNSAEKKGYSGTAVFSRRQPLDVAYGMGIEEHDREGRVITCEFDQFYFVNVYTPNAQRELARLDYRMGWEDAFRDYLLGLDQKKPVILCGDLNVAHKEIDLKNPGPNKKNAGFTKEERDKFTALLQSGFTDTFRLIYPDKAGAYTWWSYMAKARQNNAGWRIDYFVVSQRLEEKISNALIYSQVYGSDHCPVGLEINI